MEVAAKAVRGGNKVVDQDPEGKYEALSRYSEKNRENNRKNRDKNRKYSEEKREQSDKNREQSICKSLYHHEVSGIDQSVGPCDVKLR
jgi:hypothetical protein